MCTISCDHSQLSKIISDIFPGLLVSVVESVVLVDHLRSGCTELIQLL